MAFILLYVGTMPSHYRHTKIIATLGPATESKEMLSNLIRGGVDILRLNMAHASHQWVADAMWFIREVSSEVERHVAVMMDVKGPEIRTGPVEEPIPLAEGDRIEFTIEGVAPTGDVPSVTVNYPGLPNEIEPGDTVLLAPAAKSFDQYNSFEARGDHFIEIVSRLTT